MRKSIWLIAVLCAPLFGCNSSSSTTTTPPPGGGSGTLALNAADRPATTPCPTQMILTDQTELDALKTALQMGTVVHMDVPFNGSDPDIFRKKCGLEGFWNPADAVNEVAPIVTPVTISSLLQFENAGICSTGFVNFGVDDGFPSAGTYRKEFKVAHMGMTYHVRTRVTVTGSAAGNTFMNEGVNVPADIENGLIYEVNGTPWAHDMLIAAAVSEFTVVAGDAPVYTIDVRKVMAGPIVFTAKVEIICVVKM